MIAPPPRKFRVITRTDGAMNSSRMLAHEPAANAFVAEVRTTQRQRISILLRSAIWKCATAPRSSSRTKP